MKFIVLFTVFLLFTSGKPILEEGENGIEEVIEVTSGLLAGAFGSISSIDACIDGGLDALSHFSQAIQEIEDDGFIDVVKGFKDLAIGFHQVSDALSSWEDIQNTVSKLETLAVNFANPTMLVVNAGHNIIWHSISIAEEIEKAIDAYESGDLYKVGSSIGSISNFFLILPLVSHVFLSAENPDQVEGQDFVDGFSYGLSPNHFTQAIKCTPKIGARTNREIIQGLEKLSGKDVSTTLPKIINLSQIYQSVLNCGPKDDDFKMFFENFDKFSDHVKTFPSLGKNFKEDSDFIKVEKQIMEALSKQNYYKCGKILGDFISQELPISHKLIMISS